MCEFFGGSGCDRDSFKLLCFWYVGLSFSVGCLLVPVMGISVSVSALSFVFLYINTYACDWCRCAGVV